MTIRSFIRRYLIPRREFDLAISHRDAYRDHFAQLQKEYLTLESKMMEKTGYSLANVDVSIEMPPFAKDNSFCWRMGCSVTRELTVALREKVSEDLLPYIAENFKREILQKLKSRWIEVSK